MKRFSCVTNYKNGIEGRFRNKRIFIPDGKPCIDAPEIKAYSVFIKTFDPKGERELCAHSFKEGKGKIHVNVLHLTEETLFAITDMVRLRLEYLQQLKSK